MRVRPQLFGGYGGGNWQSRGRQDQRGERRLITGQDGGQETERLYFDDPAAEGETGERASGSGEEGAVEAR